MDQGNVYTLSVTDDRPGMDNETIQKIFGPFYTKKKTGRGLELATVLGITRSHKSALKVDSTPGSGTEIGIFSRG